MSASKLFMAYVPLNVIKKKLGMSIADINTVIEPYIADRAIQSLEAIDLTEYADQPPIVKMLITKLSILRNELFRRAHNDFDTLTLAEKVDNFIKRIKVNDLSEWVESTDDISIIEETGGYVGSNWVYQAESASEGSMVAHAKVLTDKFLMRPDDMVAYHNWDEHLERCVRMEIDPKKYTEEEAIEMERLIEGYRETLR